MGFGCIDALALPAVDMPGGSFEVVPGGLDDVPRDITWTAELLYSFELFFNSVGVRVTPKAVPAVALAWEAQAKADSPEFHAELAKLSQMDGLERLDSMFGHTWASSIRDFFTSDACVGYGTANFRFGSGLTAFVRECMGVASDFIYTPYFPEFASPDNYHHASYDSYHYDFSIWFDFLASNPANINSFVEYHDVYIPNGYSIVCFYVLGPYNLLYYVLLDVDGNLTYHVSAKTYMGRYYERINGTASWESRNFGENFTYRFYVDADLFWQHFPYPVFNSQLSARDWIETGLTYGALHLPAGIEEVDIYSSPISELQVKALVDVPAISDIFTIPTTAEERETVLAGVREADTTEILVKALADVGVLVGDSVDNPPVVDVEPSLAGISKVLSSILSAIVSIPDRIITGLKELLISLLVPSPDYFRNKIDSLLSLLKSVLPYADYIKMLETIGNFSGGELKDITVTIMGATATVVSFGSFREILPTVRSWARGVFFVFMVIYYINQIYKLIRNTRLYEGMLPPSGKG